MSNRLECRYYGRDFTQDEMALLRALIAGRPALNRSRISTEFCRRTGWTKPDGGLKSMMARVTMLRMHRDGRIVLRAAAAPQGAAGQADPLHPGHRSDPLRPARQPRGPAPAALS